MVDFCFRATSAISASDISSSVSSDAMSNCSASALVSSSSGMACFPSVVKANAASVFGSIPCTWQKSRASSNRSIRIHNNPEPAACAISTGSHSPDGVRLWHSLVTTHTLIFMCLCKSRPMRKFVSPSTSFVSADT